MSEYTKIIIRDLRLVMGIGVYPGEKSSHQPVLINVVADVRVPEGGWKDSYDTVVCYDKITQGIRHLAATGHIHLAETLAEGIADICLKTPGITGVMVRVEKTAILPDAAAVGVEIRRSR
jgi:dihydroneopterin aldolase